MLGIEHSPRNFAFGLAPSPVLFVWFFLEWGLGGGLKPSFTIGYNPSPPRTYHLSLPRVFLPSYFIIIFFSNPNVQYVSIFFISACQISPRIKINNMNLYAESAESRLLIEIQGLNNCIFRKHKHL